MTSTKRYPNLAIPVDAIRRGSYEEFKEAIEKGLGCINDNHTSHDDDPYMRECLIYHGLVNKLIKRGNLELLLYLAQSWSHSLFVFHRFESCQTTQRGCNKW
jgi:hypothetical protein